MPRINDGNNDQNLRYRRLPVEAADAPSPGGSMNVFPVGADILAAITSEAFADLAYYMSASYLEKLAAAARDQNASPEERFVMSALIKNAVIAAEGVLPVCQDTGTATIIAWKGEDIKTGADDRAVMSAAIRDVWRKYCLRNSQVMPSSMFEEKNTGDNLPAQIDIHAVPGREYHFLFIAKGGGSANKTTLLQGSKAILNESALSRILSEQIRALGTAACPPYHLAVVVGGTSPENNLFVLKLATTGRLDSLLREGVLGDALAFRDPEWEARVMNMARETGFGAQFGGRYLALDACVVRLPRHAGSCPVSIGVSCCAHRNMRGKITPDGVFLEELEGSPARFLDACENTGGFCGEIEPTARIDLDRPMEDILESLAGCRKGALIYLSGAVVLARDMAHERFRRALKEGRGLPDYLKKHPVFYAGPSETPPGRLIGSLGPTTSMRMDRYVPELMEHGASRVMLGKGGRSRDVTDACRRHGGYCLAVIGGAAALIAQEHVISADVIDFADLGMESVRRVTVKNLPAIILP